MNKKLIGGVILSSVLVLSGCGSTPTWEGMSQTDISEWKELGLDAAASQGWKEAGISAADAADWIAAKFDLEEASEWASEAFTAAEAADWKIGGFDLKDAVNAREKGLSPTK
ncbi:MAG: hypothetical protein V7459_11470 [Oceanicoccus sp.]